MKSPLPEKKQSVRIAPIHVSEDTRNRIKEATDRVRGELIGKAKYGTNGARKP